MALIQTAAPAGEPVTLAEAKAQVRVDGDHDDGFLASLITTSRLQIETALDLALITQSWRWTGTRAPGGLIALRPFPVARVIDVFAIDADGTETAVSGDAICQCADDRPFRIKLAGASGGVSGRIAVDFEAGFGAVPDAVPGPIRQALLMLVAHWYENREPVLLGTSATKIPAMVSELLAPYREARL